MVDFYEVAWPTRAPTLIRCGTLFFHEFHTTISISICASVQTFRRLEAPIKRLFVLTHSDFELNPRVWVPFRSFSNCQKVWLVLFLIFQAMLNEASRVLYNAMDEKVYFSDAIVVVPPDWSNSKCKEQIQTPMSDLVFRVRFLQFKTYV